MNIDGWKLIQYYKLRSFKMMNFGQFYNQINKKDFL